MSSSQSLSILLFLSIVTFTFAALDPNKLPKNTAIHFPIRKNDTSLKYYTTFQVGALPTVVDALIDLDAESVWVDCRSYVSSTYKRISCGSNRCQKTKGSLCVGCDSTPRPGCSNKTCAVLAFNHFRLFWTAQELGEDTMRVSSTDGRFVLRDYDAPKFQFTCAGSRGSDITEGLPGDHTIGSVGLARTQLSLASQISSSFNLAPKFALCLPSSSKNGLGDIYVGGGPYYLPPSIKDQSFSLVRTPLVVNPVSTPAISPGEGPSNEYFISVQHIEISGKRVSLNSSLLSLDNGVGGTKISTIAPYTTFQASIYERLIKDYVKAAAVKKIKRVTSVSPFGACFDSRTAPKTTTGPGVPDIDIVLPGNAVLVRLKLSGSNLMVEVKKNVICLAIIDGGAEPRTSIVLGGHQLENRLLEFDLSTSRLGFTPSLLLSNTSCSHFRLF